MLLSVLQEEIVECRRCPRLVEYRARVASTKRRAFREYEYWGKPVPSFGDPAAELLIVGLAPGAHGANRTGRMFTGDRSGEFLYRALHATRFASQAESEIAGATWKGKSIFFRTCAWWSRWEGSRSTLIFRCCATAA
jgi:uracil-DNA glycosylase